MKNKNFGQKTENLRKLLKIGCRVPDFEAISSEEIYDHINKNFPEFQDLWLSFCEEQKISPDDLSITSLEILNKIRSGIITTFSQHKIDFKLPQGSKKFMIRSTGNEDSAQISNPGGNESFVSDDKHAAKFMAEVIASYFSEKSFKQRLSQKDDISILPIIPCLVQNLVGEEDKKTPVTSGVIYVNQNGQVTIDSAFGHGDAVVNSKVECDSFFVSSTDTLYSDIKYKEHRFVPVYSNGSMPNLQQVTNSFEFGKKSSLSVNNIKKLTALARKVCEEYGMNMDLEFVVDNEKGEIYIVQARPIPAISTTKNLLPSFVNNEYLINHKLTPIKAICITKALNTSLIIHSKDEYIYCNNIEEAHALYQKRSKNEQEKIKAIFIKEGSAETSHYAGFFRSLAINVTQVEKAPEIFKDKVLVLDPQNNAMYQIHESDKDICIQEGLSRSSLSPDITQAYNLNLEPSPKLKTDTTLKSKKLSFVDIRKKINLLYSFSDKNSEIRKNIILNLLSDSEGLKKIGLSNATYDSVFAICNELIKNIDNKPNYLDAVRKLEGIFNNAKQEVADTFKEKRINNFSDDSKQLEYNNELLKLNDIALTESTKKSWSQYCQKALEEGKSDKLGNIVAKIIERGIAHYWINGIFEDEKNMSLDDLYLKYSGDAFNQSSSDFKIAQEIVTQIERDIPNFADPEKFGHLSSKLENQISQFNNIMSKYSDLPIDILFKRKLMIDIANIIDLAVKQVQLSDSYPKDQKLRLKNYGDILSIYNSLLQPHIFYDNANNATTLTYTLKACSNMASKGDLNQLNIPGNFAVNSTLLSSNRSQFERGITLMSRNLSSEKIDLENPNITLACLHSTLHQNMLYYASLKGNNLIPIIQSSLPNDLQQIINNILKLNSGIQYSIDPSFPVVNIKFNIPLDVHSAQLDLSYDCKTKNVVFNVNYFGFGALTGSSRWKNLCMEVEQIAKYLTLDLSNILQNQAECKFRITTKSMKDTIMAIATIEKANAMTYNDGGGLFYMAATTKTNNPRAPKSRVSLLTRLLNNHLQLPESKLSLFTKLFNNNPILIRADLTSSENLFFSLVMEYRQATDKLEYLRKIARAGIFNKIDVEDFFYTINEDIKKIETTIIYEMPRPINSEYIEKIFGLSGLDIFMTPIERAINSRNVEKVRYIINNTIDVNSRHTASGISILFYAILNNDIKMVDMLIKEGANVSFKDYNGMTPIRHAISIGNEDIVKKLIDAGADLRTNLIDPAMKTRNQNIIDMINIGLAAQTLRKANVREDLSLHARNHNPSLLKNPHSNDSEKRR